MVEPYTRSMLRHTGGQRVAFGRQVIHHAGRGWHPTEQHQALFDHPPGLAAGDRGIHAADTEARLQQLARSLRLFGPRNTRVLFAGGLASARVPVAASPACAATMDEDMLLARS